MTLNKNGGGAHRRTQHIAIRQEFVTEHLRSGAVASVYVPGTEIGSDLGTKPMFGSQLKFHNATWGVVE